MSDINASAAAEAPRTTGVVGESLDPASAGEPSRSTAAEAWRSLRRNPIFVISALLIVVLVVMAAFPTLFTDTDPDACVITEDPASYRQPPVPGHVFGIDALGCDVFARTIHGARASVLVGLFCALITFVVGGTIGLLAGYFGGWFDAVLSRITDIFFAIPLLLGAILVLTVFPAGEDNTFVGSIGKITLAMTLLGWTSMARVTRAAAIQVRHADFVEASRALGGSNLRLLWFHVLPNAIAPGIVVSTIALGGFISGEATLSYLGVGLQDPHISWGLAISEAQASLRTVPTLLLFPGAFLSVTVLAFIMLGDAVRDALDPKMR